MFNVYNHHLAARCCSVPLEMCFKQFSHPVLVIGDFNIYSPAADPLCILSADENRLSSLYTDYTTATGYALLNSPGTYTRYSPSSTQRHSAIDLSFANSHLFPLVMSWQALKYSSGSDHRILAILLSPPLCLSSPPMPNWKFADWESISQMAKDLILPAWPAASSQIAAWFKQSLNLITSQTLSHVPIKPPSVYS